MINTLPKDLRIDSIFHISDIHIRLFKRHGEYKNAFEKLYQILDEYVTNNSNPCICITGDIAHSKNELSPEFVDVVSEFLTRVASYAPTIVIAGNHDTNLANMSRLDALTPIVQNIKTDNLYYLRNTDTYELDNCIIGVFSLLDDATNWPINPVSSKTKIALFHGPVYGAKTEVGYEIKSEDIKTSLFFGYDMVLLGDIHKYQVLEDGSNGPIVVYPGSLIQQDYGEGILGHKYIIWDVNAVKMTPYEFNSGYAFVTYTFKDDKLVSSTMDKNTFVENLRTRFIVENTSDETIQKFLTTLKKKHTIIDTTVNKKISLSTGNVDSKSVFGNDITDVGFQNEILSKYMSSRYPDASKTLRDKVLKLNIDVNNMCSKDDLPRSIMWKPIRMSFSNLFSYGKDNEINFQDLNGVVGLFAPNAYGKSSTFDALCFALYDKTPRATKGNQIMNTREDTCSCDLEFEINNERYFISRVGKRKKDGDVKIDVDFYKIEADGTKVSLNGTERRYTNNNIKSFVGEYDDFILTTLSVQDKNSLFIDRGQSDRKDVLGQFIGLSIFDRLHSISSDQAKEMTVELNKLKKTDHASVISELEKSRTTIKEKMDNLSESKLPKIAELDRLNTEIDAMLTTKLPINIPSTNITSLTALQDQLVKEIATMVEKIQNNSKEIGKYADLLSSMVIDDSALPELESKKAEAQKLIHEVDKKKIELKSIQTRIKTCELTISQLKNHKYNPDCEYCVDNVFVKNAMKAKDELVELESFKQILEEQISNLSSQIVDTSSIDAEITDIKKKMAMKLQVEKTITTLKESISSLNLSIEKSDNKLAQTNAAIAAYYEAESSILHNMKVDENVAQLRSEKTVLSAAIANIDKLDKALFGEMKVIETKIEQVNSELERIAELESSYDMYDMYIKCMHRDGIPYHLMKEVLPVIQEETNNILAQMTDFTVELDMDGKNINAQLVYDETRKWPLELASGMEKFISSLAIRVSLMKISNLPRSNFLIVDEGLGTLDPDNLNSIASVFDYLKTQFSFIFLISHLDAARDISDVPVDITKIDGYSFIKV